jgi:hypothetical protein
MQVPINVKSPYNTSKWQMEFNSAFKGLNMFKTIEGAADCEIQYVIRFLNVRNVLPSEIHYHICQVYADNAMSDGMVRKCVRMFNEGRENMHDEARSRRPFLVIATDFVRQ